MMGGEEMAPAVQITFIICATILALAFIGRIKK